MKRTAEWALAVAALILTGAFLSAVSGGGLLSPGEGFGAPRDGRYFHAGKTAPAAAGDRGCRSPGCHVGMPHARGRTQAAFRNMHMRFVECLVCHGKDSRKSWTAVHSPPENRSVGGKGSLRSRWTIAAPGPAVEPGKMHGLIGPALSCRACHSEDGYRELAGKGVRDLPAGFTNPVALRMIEEGARQWIPDTMR